MYLWKYSEKKNTQYKKKTATQAITLAGKIQRAQMFIKNSNFWGT